MDFKAGQVWTYNNRPAEANSRLTILQVDATEAGEPMVHIHVNGLAIHNPNQAELIEYIVHMPFSLEAIENSVQELVGEGDIPDYLEGYQMWKEEYDEGNAGFFSVTVGEAVTYMDEIINS